MLSTIFCAVPAFIRDDPAITSGPTTGAILTTAVEAIRESGLQVTAIAAAPTCRAYSTAPVVYGVLPLADMPTIQVFLTPDRAALRERIDSRFRSMIDAGALEEVARLDARRLDPLLPVMRAHGVPRLREALAGTSSLEEAIVRAQAETRQYAKRQVTFFRHQLPEFVPVPPELAEEAILNSLHEICGNGA